MKPEPDSETRKPKEGFAITLIHGCGRAHAFAENDHIFAAVFGEATQAVEKARVRRATGAPGLFSRAGGETGAAGREAGLGPLRSIHLLGQRAAPAEDHRPRHGLKQRAHLRRDQIRREQENIAEGVSAFRRDAQLAAAHERFERALQILRDRSGPFR